MADDNGTSVSGSGGANIQSLAERSPQTGDHGSAITPEMVRQIADRVYARLLLDMKYEFERYRFLSQGIRHQGGR